MRVLVVVALAAGVADADPPTKQLAEQAARRWIESGTIATDTSRDPFLFDHDSKACRQHRKARDIVRCLLEDERTSPIRTWAPTRVRIHADASFASWQRDASRDIIGKHRKQLAKLKDHLFVHFDAPGDGGVWEMLLPIKLDADGSAVVDGYLASFLAGADDKVDELDARVLATNWVRGMAGSDDDRRSTASRTGYPFWSLGLPMKGCKPDQRAKDSRQFAELAACVAASPDRELLERLPRAKWELLADPARVKTRADDDHFAAALPMLDRLAHDHIFLFNRVSAPDAHFEILLAIRREGEGAVVDAAIANTY